MRKPWILALISAITVGTAGGAVAAVLVFGRSPQSGPKSAMSAGPGSATSSPSVATTSPTPAPFEVSVALCPTTYGANGTSAPPSPTPILGIPRPPGMTGVSGYSDGGTTMLAPSGWSCSAQVGADGVDTVTVQASSGPVNGIISGGQDSACQGCIWADVCRFFPSTAPQSPNGPCPAPPTGERVLEQLNSSTVLYMDPAGSYASANPDGSVVPDGSTNPLLGVVIYLTQTGTLQGNAGIHAECVLDPDQSALCEYLLLQFAALTVSSS